LGFESVQQVVQAGGEAAVPVVVVEIAVADKVGYRSLWARGCSWPTRRSSSLMRRAVSVEADPMTWL
jgi:hypothetical protein